MRCVYSLNVLTEAFSELKKISNCSLAKGFAREIIKLRKRYLHSCRLKELTQEIIKAINTYDEGPNFELICAEDKRNSEKRATFWETVLLMAKSIFLIKISLDTNMMKIKTSLLIKTMNGWLYSFIKSLWGVEHLDKYARFYKRRE